MSYRSVEDINSQIAKLQQELDKAIELKKVLDSYTLPQRVAILMHDKTCHHNHADGCGWGYEISKGRHDFSGSAHSYYLNKATHMVQQLRTILGETDDEVVLNVVTTVISAA